MTLAWWNSTPVPLEWMATFAISTFMVPVTFLMHLFNFFFPPPPGVVAPKCVLITGAGSGIGRALAQKYAGPGVTLALSDLSEAGLVGVRAECEEAGAVVVSAALDVTDAQGMADWIKGVDAATPVDLVIANAGVTAETVGLGPPRRDEVDAVTRRVFGVNLMGVFNTVLPLVQPMKDRKGGQIALVASQASLGPVYSYAYGGSKAAVRFWGEGLRQDLVAWGIAVNVVCPGFVRSPLTDKVEHMMPGMVEMEDAVEAIVSGLAVNNPVVSFPAITFIGGSFMGAMPHLARDAMARMGLVPLFKARRCTAPRVSAEWDTPAHWQSAK